MLDKNEFYKQNKIDFQFKLLSILQNGSQKGSTLAVGVALGALMIGGTVLAIATSSQNKTNVIADEQSAQAVAAAEAGIARIQDIIAREPRLAMKKDWSEIASKNNNSDVLLAINNIVESSPDENNNDLTCNPDGQSDSNGLLNEVQAGEIKQKLIETVGISSSLNGENKWVKFNKNTEYKLVEIKPADITKNTPATVTLQGKTNNGATTQLLVDIPIKKDTNPDDKNTGMPTFGPPGLWAQSFDSPINSSGSVMDVNVLDSSGCNKGNSSWQSFISQSNNLTKSFKGQVEVATVPFPPLPNGGKYEIPDNAIKLSSCPTTTTTTTSKNGKTTTTSGPGVLPRSGDAPVTGDALTGTYIYQLDLNCPITVGVSGQETVKLFYKSGLEINAGNYKVATNGSNRETRVIVYGNNGLTMSNNGRTERPENFQFYIYDGDITAGGNSSQFTSGFIFAPKSNALYNGNGAHHGALWVKSISFKGGGNSGGMIGNLDGNSIDALEINPDPNGPRPTYKSFPATRWERQPVSENN